MTSVTYLFRNVFRKTIVGFEKVTRGVKSVVRHVYSDGGKTNNSFSFIPSVDSHLPLSFKRYSSPYLRSFMRLLSLCDTTLYQRRLRKRFDVEGLRD